MPADVATMIGDLVRGPSLRLLPVVVLGSVAVWFTVRALINTVRYVVVGRDVRPVLRKAWRIGLRWKHDARRVGLTQIERGRPRWWSSTPAGTLIDREMIPKVTVKAERWGVRVDAATYGRIGLQKFQDAAPHLADIWKVPHVRVEQLRPGVVRLRAIVRDPLTEPAQWTDERQGTPTPTPALAPADPRVWYVGVDADGLPVTLRCSGVSGVVVAGLAGYGKTSLLNARLVQLAPLPSVQFVLIDGKGGPDYDDLFARAWLSAKSTGPWPGALEA